jgi:hypothetical protein
LIFFCLIFSISSCATSGRDAIEPPKYTPWDYLTSLNRERPGYAMYTYVLFNRRTKLLEEIHPDIAEVYSAVLETIEKAPLSTNSMNVRADERNIFYVPSISAKKERILSLDNYNINLSFSYISRFISVMKTDYIHAEKFATEPGPFLVSLFSPLQYSVNTSKMYQNDFHLFFVDLSKFPVSSIKDIVETYRNFPIKKTETGIRALTILKSDLISLLPAYESEFKILKGSAEYRDHN